MTPSHPPIDDKRTEAYWCGYLHDSLRNAAEEIETAGGDSGSTRRALREYEASDTHQPRVITGWAVMSAQRECFAIRSYYIDAEKARGDALNYLHGAETCGHSRAVKWVAAQLPFSVEMISDEDRERLLEEGTPVLDREP